jgi:hypothetical protein
MREDIGELEQQTKDTGSRRTKERKKTRAIRILSRGMRKGMREKEV